MPVRGRFFLGRVGSLTIHLRADRANWHITETIRDRIADPFVAGRMVQALIVEGGDMRQRRELVDAANVLHHRLVPVITPSVSPCPTSKLTRGEPMTPEENRWDEALADSACKGCCGARKAGHDRRLEPILRRIIDRVALAQPDNRDRGFT